jgi:F420-dependent oxidoreductase-like protein
MNVSLNITNVSWPTRDGGIATALRELVELADASSIDTVWVPDHLLQADPSSSLDEPMLEAYTTLGFLAAATRRVRLGTLVTAASVRPPALLIKAVTTLDVLSDGRAWLGLGAGYHELEAEAMGLPLPAPRERAERLGETLQIARQMWRGDETPFEGAHYRLARPINVPAPLTRPHPPILIGGMGERTTLRLVAEHADACNLFDIPDGGATVRHKLDVLARHCDELGRPYDAIEKTISTRFEPGESARAFADRCAALEQLGIGHAIAIRSGPWTPGDVATLAAAAA